MIRARTVKDAHGIERVEIKARGDIINILQETGAVIESVNKMITSTVKETKQMIFYRSYYEKVLKEKYLAVSEQLKMEIEAERDAMAAAQDDAETELAERIWKSIQPEDK